MHFFAGRIWKGDFLVADYEEMEKLDASEVRARRLIAKELIHQAEKLWIFHFPDRRWSS